MGPSLLKEITAELDEELRGGVVSKVHQPDDRTLILRIFIRGRELRLLISAHHGLPRLHLTERALANPPGPPRFCAFLRSRITNARIERVRQQDLERIVVIELVKRDGDEMERMRLVCELTGKSSNIILVDQDDVVLDALRHFPAASRRPVEPGLRLEPLPAGHTAREDGAIEKKEGESWNSAADRLCSALVEADELLAERAALRKVIADSGKRLSRKLSNLEGDKKRAEEGLALYKTGELLATVLHKLKKGMTEAEAIDYTQDPPAAVIVALDERLSPKENLERCFKRARKSKTALGLLDKMVPEVRQEMEYVASLGYELEETADMGALSELREELARAGYIKEARSRPAREEGGSGEPIRRFRSSEGFEILCGRSGLGNDLLVARYASGEDIWFHVLGAPGSHVLIKVAGRKGATQKAIEEAASIAAFYSKAKGAAKAEVIYTEARNVKKPRGAKPGMVTVKEFRSIVVRPRLPEGVKGE